MLTVSSCMLTKLSRRPGVARVTRQLSKEVVAMLVPCVSVDDVWWRICFMYYVILDFLLFVCITLHISFLLAWNRMCTHGWRFYETQLMFCLDVRWKASLYDWPVFYWHLITCSGSDGIIFLLRDIIFSSVFTSHIASNSRVPEVSKIVLWFS